MLTPSAVANAKPRPAPYKLADERGMYLLVRPDGARWWRLDYRRPVTGKRNTLSLGTFPDTSLKLAREKRDAARRLLAEGIDPGEKRKAERVAAADTFEAVAREWHAKFAAERTPGHAARILRRFEVDVFPWIGDKPVGTLAATDVLSVLRRIESRGAIETAHRTRSDCGQVMRFAVATGRAQQDVTRDLRGALQEARPEHHAAIVKPAQVGELLRAIDAFKGTFVVRCALRLAPLVFVRPGELRQAEWAEIDIDAGRWEIPASRMKMRQPHIVPLSTQAIEILRELQPLTGGGRYVFPSARDRKRPMSDAALNVALRRLGFDGNTMTAHGFRATARTLLDEVLGYRVDFIEHQLAHAVRDATGRAYNRTSHLAERTAMMQRWSDFLDELRAGGNVVALRRAG